MTPSVWKLSTSQARITTLPRLRHAQQQQLCFRKGDYRSRGRHLHKQLGTIWYDTCLPQIKDAQCSPPRKHAPQC
jgi:hypothetical protein